jgi:hypothetical protein
MATANDNMGFRKSYMITGKPGYAGGPGAPVEKGPSGSKMAPKAPLYQVPPVNSKGLKK